MIITTIDFRINRRIMKIFNTFIGSFLLAVIAVSCTSTSNKSNKTVVNQIVENETSTPTGQMQLIHLVDSNKYSKIDIVLPNNRPLLDSVYSWYISVDPSMLFEDIRSFDSCSFMFKEVLDRYSEDEESSIESFLEHKYQDDKVITFEHSSWWWWSPWGGSTFHGGTFRKDNGKQLRYKDFFADADGLKRLLEPYEKKKWDNIGFYPDSVFGAYDAPFSIESVSFTKDSMTFVWPRYQLGYGCDGNYIKSLHIDQIKPFMTDEMLDFLNLKCERKKTSSIPSRFDYRTFSNSYIDNLKVPDFMTLKSPANDSMLVFALNDLNFLEVIISPADNCRSHCDGERALSENAFRQKKDNWEVVSDYLSIFDVNDCIVYKKEVIRPDSSILSAVLYYESKYNEAFLSVIKEMFVPLK